MEKHIYAFARNIFVDDSLIRETIGLRGREAMDFAALDLPILPGFIIDGRIAAHLGDYDLKDILPEYFVKLEEDTKKRFNDPATPMLVKIVVSPNLAIINYPALHNFGLTEKTILGFNKFVGEHFGYHEALYLIRGALTIEQKIAELENNSERLDMITKKIVSLAKEMDKAKDLKKVFDEYGKLLPADFFSDAYVQLEYMLKRISVMLDLDELDDEDTALIVQPMVYGNFGKDSASGMFYTRNIVTGEKKLEGLFNRNEFDTLKSKGKDINEIEPKFLKDLTKIAQIVEDHFREIRSIRFTIENNNLWLMDQRPLMAKSTQADIKTLLDLYNRKVIADEYLINAVKPEQLNEILHPIINLKSVKNIPYSEGGISGAPGAAIGQIYFSTEDLLEAHKNAQHAGKDVRMILCMPASFAEDVKAIEVSTGVLSNEGGYAAHASVVARQYGKVSLVKPEMKITGKKVIIGNHTVNEGDFITLNVPHYGEPQIYFGKAELIEPDPQQSGLIEFTEIAKKRLKDFHVRVNADKPRDAELARKFGAEGIGLCRTEHMFFEAERINVFRQMIISDNTESRKKALAKLKKMQTKDFSQLLSIMEGKEVTIRLLDAPLHEFLPHNQDEMNKFIAHLKASGGEYAKMSAKSVQAVFDSLREFNPMLGHRGCRIAVSYPEIYEMQIQSIFEAAYELKAKGIDVRPEIMIPLIMNEEELKLIVYGKKIEGYEYQGLINIERELRRKLNVEPLHYKIGTMIELPVAALGAGQIAKYAEFFSFGTNDLTQTTIGLSRDDYNSFMPDYTLYDIIAGNPFRDLNEYVKELIAIAVRRGTLTRPTLKKGLCGEHGAVPDNIKYCMDVGLDYVSCSVFSVPIAILAIAQFVTAGSREQQD